MRFAALIEQTDIHPASRHSVGMPLGLGRPSDSQESMPWPRIVLTRQGGRGVFLDRFTEDGESAGDTWHESLEDARDQALEEYNGSLGRWHEVPEGLEDADVITYLLGFPFNEPG